MTWLHGLRDSCHGAGVKNIPAFDLFRQNSAGYMWSIDVHPLIPEVKQFGFWLDVCLSHMLIQEHISKLSK